MLTECATHRCIRFKALLRIGSGVNDRSGSAEAKAEKVSVGSGGTARQCRQHQQDLAAMKMLLGLIGSRGKKPAFKTGVCWQSGENNFSCVWPLETSNDVCPCDESVDKKRGCSPPEPSSIYKERSRCHLRTVTFSNSASRRIASVENA